MKQRIFIQTVFFALCFLAIGASYGYYEAMREVAAHHRQIEIHEKSEAAK